MIRRSGLLAAAFLMFVFEAQGQTIRISCPRFGQDSHQRYACIEALLSQDNYHFTLASLPPGNGFAPGLVLTHTLKPDNQQLDLSLIGGVSVTNGSTIEEGDMLWTLPYGSHDTSTSPQDLQSAAHKNWDAMSFHLQGAHEAVHTVYFYGYGPGSADEQFVYAEDDVWGNGTVRVPISRRIVLTGETGLRSTTLPSDSDSNAVDLNFPAAIMPGETQQPLFVISRAGAESRVAHEFGHPLPDVKDADSLIQYFSNWEWDNNATFAWYHDTDSAALSFRQFTFTGEEKGLFYGRVAVKSYDPKKHHLLYYTLCQGESHKRTEFCNALLVDVHTRLILSDVGSESAIPFYLQPTLGGSDFGNTVTLRGWPDYRFRANDSALTQLDLNAVLRDPFGIDVFYDAGTVGSSAGDLSISNWRQDAGVGLTVRLQGSIVAQSYWAWGAGHGANWGYNFAKTF